MRWDSNKEFISVIIDSGQKLLLIFPRNQDVHTLLMAYIVRGLQNNNYYDLVKWLLEMIKDKTWLVICHVLSNSLRYWIYISYYKELSGKKKLTSICLIFIKPEWRRYMYLSGQSYTYEKSNAKSFNVQH